MDIDMSFLVVVLSFLPSLSLLDRTKLLATTSASDEAENGTELEPRLLHVNHLPVHLFLGFILIPLRSSIMDSLECYIRIGRRLM